MSCHAPYNFVPLSALVFEPKWNERVSQDVPFSDGISGSIEIELTAETALCVGDRMDGNVVRPFQVNGSLAIPGTSIKGMLRNVLEIASFSKMQFVDGTRRYAVRDLHGKFYRDRMTATVNNNIYVSKVKTGWLELDEKKQWTVRPCKMARVEHEQLLSKAQDKQNLKNVFKGQSKSFEEKYRYFGEDRTQQKMWVDQTKDHPMSRARGRLRFQKAFFVQPEGSQSELYKGTLVLTGQPSPRKHREFFFFNEEEKTIDLDPQVCRDFQLNHSADQGENHAGGDPNPNAEWEYWRKRLKKGERVPIFYLEKDRRIDSFGLAFMYRLAYANTIGNAIENTTKLHDPSPAEGYTPKSDMAELIFGRVRSDDSHSSSLRGRAAAGLFSLVEGGLDKIYNGILNGPKPTYYPNYIKQKGAGKPYKTLMDGSVEIRGWKRYPVRPRHETPPIPTSEQTNVSSSWQAVRPGSKFRGKIHIHNLRPAELGALLWSLDFGGNGQLRHSLGKAKPFGFGAVKLSIIGRNLKQLTNYETLKNENMEASKNAFLKLMSAEHPNWAQSVQIAQLSDMADPRRAEHKELTYMSIAPHNEFVSAKNDKQVLEPYTDKGDSSHEAQFKTRAKEEEKKKQAKAREQERARVERKKKQSIAGEIPLSVLEATWNTMSDFAQCFSIVKEDKLAKIMAAEKDPMKDVWPKLATFPKEQQRELAAAFKERWKKYDRWNVPRKKKKQYEKVRKVNAILGEKGR